MKLDHIILACPDLEAGCEEVKRRLGIELVTGGRHENMGTHNALAGLNQGAYLELLAPDAKGVSTGLAQKLRTLGGVTLYHWAVSHPQSAPLSRVDGILPESWVPGRRRLSDGSELTWHLMFPQSDLGALVPFFIDWGDTPSPGKQLEASGRLAAIRLRTPRANVLAAWLKPLPQVQIEEAAQGSWSIELISGAERWSLSSVSDHLEGIQSWH
ncbi:MAG: VOC family protein [Pseudomonadota bacterium]